MTTSPTFCDTADVELNGLLMNTVDEFGVKWVVNDIDGWWTIPEPEIPDLARAFGDGSYPSRGRYNARIFTLSGTFIPPSRSAVAPARSRLMAAANLVHKSAWFATHEADFTKGSNVWLSGNPMVSTDGIDGITTFSIGLKAPDPIKYALKDRLLPGWYSTTVPGAAGTTVINEGNTRVSPIIALAGPISAAVKIKNTTTNQTISVVPLVDGDPVLASNETLTIDTKDHSVTLATGGVTMKNQRRFLKYDTDWIYLDPGPNTITFTDTATDGEPTGGGTLTVQWRHGWIA